MLPASNKGAGMNMGFPDVCNTPTPVGPIPIPYPNIAMNAQASPFATRVRLSMVNALNMSSRIPMTTGDEAGSAHPMFKQAGAYTTGNPKVFIEGVPGICLLCPTTGNNMNNPVGAVLVPSVTNVFFTYADPGIGTVQASQSETGGHEVSLEDIEDLARAIASVGAERSPVEGWMESDIGHLRIHAFSADVPGRVFSLVREMEGRGMAELVIDLRGCPGGDLVAAVELAGDFLPHDSPIARIVDSEGDETVLRGGSEGHSSMPVTVLVDGGTASAAEVFASALEAQARAVILGGPTWGKRTVGHVTAAGESRAWLCTTSLSLRRPQGPGGAVTTSRIAGGYDAPR